MDSPPSNSTTPPPSPLYFIRLNIKYYTPIPSRADVPLTVFSTKGLSFSYVVECIPNSSTSFQHCSPSRLCRSSLRCAYFATNSNTIHSRRHSGQPTTTTSTEQAVQCNQPFFSETACPFFEHIIPSCFERRLYHSALISSTTVEVLEQTCEASQTPSATTCFLAIHIQPALLRSVICVIRSVLGTIPLFSTCSNTRALHSTCGAKLLSFNSSSLLPSAFNLMVNIELSYSCLVSSRERRKGVLLLILLNCMRDQLAA